jgi:hypothetical protein
MNTPSKFSLLAARFAAFFAAFSSHPITTAVRDRLRVVSLLLLGFAALWVVAIPNPLVPTTDKVKVGLLAWLICKETMLAYLGYWIDRLLHPNSRPSQLQDIERMASEKRRAFIVSALLIAGGLFQ